MTKREIDRSLEALTESRSTVDVTRTMKGDYVYNALTGEWKVVASLIRKNETIYILTEDGQELDARTCFPSWNPKYKCFGRPKNDDRKRYWLP